jgi:hypothetical protein
MSKTTVREFRTLLFEAPEGMTVAELRRALFAVDKQDGEINRQVIHSACEPSMAKV